ncbi:hypothetical protein VNO77_02801 [Canavalia gladiata]|uniref:Uncharacterized protein n=1 Tax=Canavalia gladiata TaxID=3824 RepID=A0AAN9MYV2_CANGL
MVFAYASRRVPEIAWRGAWEGGVYGFGKYSSAAFDPLVFTQTAPTPFVQTPSFWHGIFSILIKDYVPLIIAQTGFTEAFAEEATEILRLFDEPIEMHLHFNQRETKSSIIVAARRQPLFLKVQQ